MLHPATIEHDRLLPLVAEEGRSNLARLRSHREHTRKVFREYLTQVPKETAQSLEALADLMDAQVEYLEGLVAELTHGQHLT